MRKILFAALLCLAIFAAGNFINPANLSANSKMVVNEVELQIQPLTTGSYFWGTVINCSNYIYLHEAPSVHEKRICKVPLGAAVVVYKGRRGMGSYSPDYGCYYANYNGQWGWCPQQYIQIGPLIEMNK